MSFAATTFSAFFFSFSLTNSTNSHSPMIPKFARAWLAPKPARAVAVSFFWPKTWRLQEGTRERASRPPARPINRAVIEEPTKELLLMRVSYKNDISTLRFYKNSASLRDARPAYRKSVQFEYTMWWPLRVFEQLAR